MTLFNLEQYLKEKGYHMYWYGTEVYEFRKRHNQIRCFRNLNNKMILLDYQTYADCIIDQQQLKELGEEFNELHALIKELKVELAKLAK